MSKHTPLPWAVCGPSGTQICCKDGRFIADCSVGGALYDSDENRANAERIVNAVNAHGDLMDACDRLVTLTDLWCGELPQSLAEAAEQAMAAIEKATGDS